MRLFPLLPRACLCGVAAFGAVSCGEDAPDDDGQRVLGEQGRERWVVTFEGEELDLSPYHLTLQANPAGVPALQAQMVKAASDKHAEFRAAVVAMGGAVVEMWWMTNACTIEIPAAAVKAVRSIPGVKAVAPDRSVADL